MTRILCEWRRIRFSRFLRGQISSIKGLPIERIYMHSVTGQIRIYSAADFDGQLVTVNDGEPVRMRARGFYGMLYIGMPDHQGES